MNKNLEKCLNFFILSLNVILEGVIVVKVIQLRLNFSHVFIFAQSIA